MINCLVFALLALHADVLVIAHRSALSSAPENTLPAIEQAIDSGFDYAEVDVRVTRDGRAILMHDPTLEGRLKAELVCSLT